MSLKRPVGIVMKYQWQRIAGLLLVAVCCVASAQAGESGKRPWHWPWSKTSCGCCPDQYCPKPLPAVGLRWCGCGEAYCPKPLPGVPCLPPGCGVCYDGKPLPCPPHCGEPWYRCTPGDAASCGNRLLVPLVPAQGKERE